MNIDMYVIFYGLSMEHETGTALSTFRIDLYRLYDR